MSEDDETSYLLRNAAGAKRLLEALERARHGEFVERELIEPADDVERHDPRE
jgi:antitoxin YefM